MTRRTIAAVALATTAVGAASFLWTDARSWLSARLSDVRANVPLGTAPSTAGGSRDGAAAPGPAVIPRAAVTLDTRRQQLIGVRTSRAQRVMVRSEVRAVGSVRYDETRQTDINVRVEGWIRNLQADSTGKIVRAGEPLFALYSPELIATQEELLLAVRGQTTAVGGQMIEVHEYSTKLVEAALERLRRLGMPQEELDALERRGVAFETVAVRSPVSGVIVDKVAVEGMHVTAGQTLLRIADPSTVWVEADVYERDLAAVRVGQQATVTLDAYQGQPLVGRVTYMAPTVEEQTRTVKVRLQFPNPRGQLKPGMYANVQVTGAATAALTVPADAVLDSGMEQVVFVALGDGYFEPRRVRAGRRMGDAIEIAEGLTEGEEVADGATFFLDSESQIRAAVRGFEPPPSPGVTRQAPGERVGITFRSQPDPPRVGDNMIEVSVRDGSGQPVLDAEVSVTFFMAAMPTMNMPAMRSEARVPHVSGGVYRGPGQILTPGRWDVTVTATRGGQRLGSQQLSVMPR